MFMFKKMDLGCLIYIPKKKLVENSVQYKLVSESRFEGFGWTRVCVQTQTKARGIFYKSFLGKFFIKEGMIR